MSAKQTAIVTAADQHRFTDATLYDVTYVGSSDFDARVRWSYIRRAVRHGTISAQIIARDSDGSGERRLNVEG